VRIVNQILLGTIVIVIVKIIRKIKVTCTITQTHSVQWQNVDDFYVPNKFTFSSVCGAKKSATSPLEAFLLFFDDEMIVAETNRYTDQKIRSQPWKPHSHVNSWVPVDKNEIYVYLDLIMLMEIVHNPP
jgi:hypothetical protein